MRSIYLVFIVMGLAQACSPHRQIVSAGDKSLAREVSALDDLTEHQWGMALYDPAESKWLFSKDADQYFTPASNTKILTYAAASHFLGDSSIALHYAFKGDTLIFRGTGDPSLLYVGGENDASVQLLRSHQGPVIMHVAEPPEKYGPGWAWDDYGYSYQVERTLLPIYGNRLTFRQDAPQLAPIVQPSIYSDYVVEDASQVRLLDRIGEANAFTLNTDRIREYPVETSVPFIVSDYDLQQILSSLTEKTLIVDYGGEFPSAYNTLDGVPLDSLYMPLMHDSDNFIAEQLLLQVAASQGWSMNYETILDSLKDFSFLDRGESPDPFLWYDGSGLTRYNLFTPRSLVWLLDGLLASQGIERLKMVFPAGGKSGTIKQWYDGGNSPYIFAKTGTLRNKHCLSGYIICNSGKVLIFSMMHSNYTGYSSSIKDDMQLILESIRKKY